MLILKLILLYHDIQGCFNNLQGQGHTNSWEPLEEI